MYYMMIAVRDLLKEIFLYTVVSKIISNGGAN
jgi:hypothetical protein